MSIPHADVDSADERTRNDCPGMLTVVSSSAYFDLMECNRCGFQTTVRNPAHPAYGRTERQPNESPAF